MTSDVLWLFLRKEFRDLRASPQVWPGYFILPLVAIGLPAVFLLLFPTDVSALGRDHDLAWLLQVATNEPSLARYPQAQRLGRLVIRDFAAFYLLLPIVLSSMSAALSIVLEKQQRTLEPILATPVTDRDLILAKLVAATVPAVTLTALTGGVGAMLHAGISAARYGAPFLPEVPLVVVLVLLAPAMGCAAALMGMRVSARAPDVPSAVQMSGLMVVPAGLVLAGLVGRPAASNAAVGLISALLVGLLAWWLFRGNVRRFQRELLLTRWGRAG